VVRTSAAVAGALLILLTLGGFGELPESCREFAATGDPEVRP